MPTLLYLAKDALGGHTALEVFEGPLYAAFTDADLYGLTLNCFTNRHYTISSPKGARNVAQGEPIRK
jgi:hypothetical protein